jgi:hypothetical protein
MNYAPSPHLFRIALLCLGFLLGILFCTQAHAQSIEVTPMQPGPGVNWERENQQQLYNQQQEYLRQQDRLWQQQQQMIQQQQQIIRNQQQGLQPGVYRYTDANGTSRVCIVSAVDGSVSCL